MSFSRTSTRPFSSSSRQPLGKLDAEKSTTRESTKFGPRTATRTGMGTASSKGSTRPTAATKPSIPQTNRSKTSKEIIEDYKLKNQSLTAELKTAQSAIEELEKNNSVLNKSVVEFTTDKSLLENRLAEQNSWIEQQQLKLKSQTESADRFQEQLVQANNQIQAQSMEKMELQKKIHELEMTKQSLQSIQSQCQAKIDTFETEIEHLRVRKNELETELESKQREAGSRIQSLEIEVNRLTQEMSALNLRYNKVMEELLNVRSDHDSLCKANEITNTELKEAQLLAQDLDNQNKKLTSLKEELTSDLLEFKTRCQSLESNLHELQLTHRNQTFELQEKLAQKEHDVKSAMLENDLLEKQILSLTKSTEDLDSQLHKSKQSFSDLEQRLEVLQHLHRDVENSLANTKKALLLSNEHAEELVKQLDQLNEELSGSQKLIHSQKTQIVALEEEKFILQSSVHKLSAEISEKDMYIGDLNRKVDQLSSHCQKLEATIHESATQMSLLLGDNSTISNDKSRVEQQLMAISDNLSQSLAANKAKDQEIARLQSELNELRVNNNTWIRKIEAANRAISERDGRIVSLEGEKKNLEGNVSELCDKIHSLELVRRQLHDRIEDIKGQLRVYLRVKPNMKNLPQIMKKNQIQENSVCADGKKFNFDRVYGPDASQSTIFEDLSPLVQSVFDGRNVCVFAYGQTGAGKTHTMDGSGADLEDLESNDQRGIIPRSMEQIFETMRGYEKIGWSYSLKVSFLEIYNENIMDLLTNTDAPLTLRSDENGELRVDGLKIVDVKDIYQAYRLIKQAKKRRTTAATKINEYSSRSHFLFQLYLEGDNTQQNLNCKAQLNLVDLAGSEPYGASDEKLQKKEGSNIRLSLLSLSNVLRQIHRGDKCPSFRDSQLTLLLRNSLTNGSKTVMIVNVSNDESCLKETKRSMDFGDEISSDDRKKSK